MQRGWSCPGHPPALTKALTAPTRARASAAAVRIEQPHVSEESRMGARCVASAGHAIALAATPSSSVEIHESRRKFTVSAPAVVSLGFSRAMASTLTLGVESTQMTGASGAGMGGAATGSRLQPERRDELVNGMRERDRQTARGRARATFVSERAS